MSERVCAPFAEAMAAFDARTMLPFHTPGHKQGRGADNLLRQLITETGLRRDVSVADALDDLGEPTHCLKEAQAAAARLYGAKAAYFTVNGTTGAIHTMLTATLNPGDKVLVSRNMHRSVLNGLILVGAEPIFLMPSIHEEFGIAGQITPDTVATAVRKNPSAKALIATSPNYYGETADLAMIGELLHAHSMLLLVDEAHGAHLPFAAALPPSAISVGADMAAQSTHKLLGALTQCSLLLVGSDRVNEERLHRANVLLSTTSPNNLLLASLDIARVQMERQGRTLMERAVDLAKSLGNKIDRINGLKLFRIANQDVLKVTVSVRELGLSGWVAADILRRVYHLEPELSDAYNVLFLLTYADTQESCDALYDILVDFAAKYRCGDAYTFPARFPGLPRRCLGLRESFFAPSHACPLVDSVGEIAAEQIMFYPPGIPILCPGEEIDAAAVDFLLNGRRAGGKVAGAADVSLNTIRVIGKEKNIGQIDCVGGGGRSG